MTNNKLLVAIACVSFFGANAVAGMESRNEKCLDFFKDKEFCSDANLTTSNLKTIVNSGTGGLIHDIGYSTDGNLIASVTLNQINIFNKNGVLLNRFSLPSRRDGAKGMSVISAWAISKNEKHLLAITNEGVVAVFDIFSGKRLHLDILNSGYLVTAARFVDDGFFPGMLNGLDYFITTGVQQGSSPKLMVGIHKVNDYSDLMKNSLNKYLEVADDEIFTDIKVGKTFDFDKGIFVAALVNSGKTIFAISNGTMIEVEKSGSIGLTTRKPQFGALTDFSGFSNTIQTWGKEKKHPHYKIVGSSVSEDKEGIEIYKLNENKKINELKIKWPDFHTAISIAPNKEQFVAGTRAGLIRIGKTSNGERVNNVDGSYVGAGIESGVASQSSRYIAFGGGLAKGYLINNTNPLVVIDEKLGNYDVKFLKHRIISIVFIEEKYLVAFGDKEEQISIYDLQNKIFVTPLVENYQKLLKLAKSKIDAKIEFKSIDEIDITRLKELSNDKNNVKKKFIVAGYQKSNAEYTGAAGFSSFELVDANPIDDGKITFGGGIVGVVSVTRIGEDGNQIAGTAAKEMSSSKGGTAESKKNIDYMFNNSLPSRLDMVGQVGSIKTINNKYTFQIEGSNRIKIKSKYGGDGVIYLFADAVVIVDEYGYFSGYGKYLNYINYISSNLSAYTSDQFFDIFHRPDIIRAKLRGEDIRPLIGDLTIEKALQNPPPKVSLGQTPEASAAKRIKIPYTITPDTGGIAEVRIFHNGKLIASDGAYKDAAGKVFAPVGANTTEAARYAKQQADRNITVTESLNGGTSSTLRDQLVVRAAAEKKCNPCKGEVAVDVIPGEENTITVVAFNRDNTIQSTPASVTFKSTLAKEAPRLWVLGVGIDQFQKISSLKNAGKDARDFICTYAGRKALGKTGGATTTNCNEDGRATSLFKPENIHVVSALQDQSATKRNILAGLDEVAAQAKPQDTFVWFVASHGMMDANGLFGIVAHDTQCLNKECTNIQGHITSNEILEASKKIKAMKQWVVLDTCHSGGLDNKLSGLYDARVSLLAKNMGLHLYASAQATEVAQDGNPGTNGVFTEQLLAGIKGAAPKNSSGQISVMTLGQYAKEKTIESTQSKNGIQGINSVQTPVIQHFGQDAALAR